MAITGRIETYVFTFLCYTSIHALRTTYSYAKTDIAKDIEIEAKFMGIVDALMLSFLGIGHFLHALQPIKQPVKSLWIAMIICGINYGLIPLCMQFSPLANIYILSVFMCINGFLQSYTWPNLLMIIHSRFNPDKYPVLLGFWSTNANVGNIMGYLTFQILIKFQNDAWEIGLIIAAIYAVANGVYIAIRFQQLQIAGSKAVRQQSFIRYDIKNKLTGSNIAQQDILASVDNLQQNLMGEKSVKSIKSANSLGRISNPNSISGLSRKSLRTLKTISNKIARGTIKSIKVVQQPEKVAQTPLSVTQVFKDPNVVLLTITFSLAKSVIYGIMLWLPLYFKSKQDLKQYSAQIPITYDIAAIFGSVAIGYLFKKFLNKGLLMIPFMVTLFICFFLLRFADAGIVALFAIIAIVGFALGGIFNTLSGLVVMELTKVIPENLKTSSLGFYSALTMAVGNITTAATQILIGFVLGKQNQQSIFLVFMIYAGICLACLVGIAYITRAQSGQLSKGQVLVIEQVHGDDDEDSGGEQQPQPKIVLQPIPEVYINSENSQKNHGQGSQKGKKINYPQ